MLAYIGTKKASFRILKFLTLIPARLLKILHVWGDYSDKTWGEMSSKTWADALNEFESGE